MIKSAEFKDYILSTYSPGEPIIASRVDFPTGKTPIRNRLKRLTDEGVLARFQNGVYYIPKQGFWGNPSLLNPFRYIEEKYIRDGSRVFGYYDGYWAVYQSGLTSQIPNCIEIRSNIATKEMYETKAGQTRLIIRKPKMEITEDNQPLLQFLSVMSNVDKYWESEGEDAVLSAQLYAKRAGVTKAKLLPYVNLFPDSACKGIMVGGIQ